MNGVLANMIARLGWEVNNKPLEQSEEQLKKIEEASVSLGKSLKWAAGIAGGISTAAGATWAWTKASAAAGNEAGKSARQIGITAEAYQELAYAAAQNGADVSNMRMAILRLNRASAEAVGGSKRAAEALESVGLNVQEFAKLTPDKQFEALADALHSVEDQGLKTSVSMTLLGRAGPAFASLFEQGSKNITEMREEARALGIVMSEQSTLDAEDFETNMDRLSAMVLGLRNAIGVELFPVFNEMVDNFREWFLANREVLRQRIGEFLRRAISLFQKLSTVVIKIVSTIDNLIQRLGGAERVGAALEAVLVALGARAVIVGINVLIARMRALSAAAIIANIKVMGIVAAFAAIYLVAEDLYHFFTGGESALGDFVDKFKEQEGFLGSLARGIVWMKDRGIPAIVSFGRRVIDMFNSTREKIGRAWDWVSGKVVRGAQWMSDRVMPIVDGIRAGFVWALDYITSEFQKARDAIGGTLETIGEIFGGVMSIMKGAWDVWFGGVVGGLATIAKGLASAGAFLGDKLGLDTEGIQNFHASMESLQGRGQAQQMRGLSTAYDGARQAIGGITQSVGSVEVTIAGSTTMGAGEVSAAVQRGVHRGLASEVDQLARLTRAGA